MLANLRRLFSLAFPDPQTLVNNITVQNLGMQDANQQMILLSRMIVAAYIMREFCNRYRRMHIPTIVTNTYFPEMRFYAIYVRDHGFPGFPVPPEDGSVLDIVMDDDEWDVAFNSFDPVNQPLQDQIPLIFQPIFPHLPFLPTIH